MTARTETGTLPPDRESFGIRPEAPWTGNARMADFALIQDPTDDELLRRTAGGDATAFAAFYDRHSALLLGIVRRILLDDAESEDVLQDSLVQVWERAAVYDPAMGRPLGWVITLTRNKAIDRLRSRHRRVSVLQDNATAIEAATQVCGDSSPASQSQVAEAGNAVHCAVHGLPDEQRQAIELAFFGGLSHMEIAVRLAIPVGTIKARIRRGMMALRDSLEGNL